MEKGEKETPTKYDIGCKLILSAASIDEAVAEILKIEAAKIKKAVKNNSSADNYSKLYNVMKAVVSIMILTNEKLEAGIRLLENDKENNIADK
jgi:hypothetical protein